MTEPDATAEQLKPYAHSTASRCWRAGWAARKLRRANEILNRAGIPTFPYPDTAARAFNYMWRYTYNLRGLYETPVPARTTPTRGPDRDGRSRSSTNARAAGRTIPDRSSNRSSCWRRTAFRPCRPTLRETEDEAVAKRRKRSAIPVVLKLHSETITHKTDVGGVQLNLRDAERGAQRVRGDSRRRSREKAGAEHFQGVTVQPMVKLDGYELIIGSSLDPQFGPVLLFGTGGQLVEVFKDRALALPPLNTTLARRMMEQTKIYKALQGRARTEAGGSRGARGVAGALQPTGGGAALDQGNRHQSAAGFARTTDRAGRARRAARSGRSRKTSCRARRSVPIRCSTSQLDHEGRHTGDHPADPSRRRAAAGQLPRDAFGTQRLPALFPPMKLSQRTAHERLTRICFIDYDREMALVGGAQE